ncbi:MAG: hypothetical protein IJV16_08705, partial [Lachnospiraceae bacterium]|nr:hypothetical protein [Lachnospiraceae bacterium]
STEKASETREGKKASKKQKSTNHTSSGTAAADPASDTTVQQPQDQQVATGSRVEVSRIFIEDCGSDTGYWDITYSDGTHEYIDVP